jgi:hypothetical protein
MCTATRCNIGEADVNFLLHLQRQAKPRLHSDDAGPAAIGFPASRQHIVAKIDAVIQNSAKERFDMACGFSIRV